MDNVVQFPIDSLDLNHYISGPKTKHLQYSLYSCVCHFGGKCWLTCKFVCHDHQNGEVYIVERCSFGLIGNTDKLIL